MRVVGGMHRGRRIDPPANKWRTRPTTDFAREALFNILHHKQSWPDTDMLDLFTGTGMMSIEAASRGCRHITAVDRYAPCTRWLSKISTELDLQQTITVIKQDVPSFLKASTSTFDLIFADPPYDWSHMLQLSQTIFDSNVLRRGGTLVIEHGTHTIMDHLPHWIEDRKYGSSTFSFFSW